MVALLQAPPRRRMDITRMPGEWGPVLRGSGELTVATAEALRRELDLLVPLGYAAITLNLSGITYLDVDGVLALLEGHKRLRDRGRTLVVVADRGLRSTLEALGVDWILPVFPSEATAAQALRGGGPAAPGPGTWEQARLETLELWEQTLEALERGDRQDVMRLTTGYHPVCERAEQLMQEAGEVTGTRCRFCPLFTALGGKPQDIGCASLRKPIMEALGSSDIASARTQIRRVIQLLREMPVEGARR